MSEDDQTTTCVVVEDDGSGPLQPIRGDRHERATDVRPGGVVEVPPFDNLRGVQVRVDPPSGERDGGVEAVEDEVAEERYIIIDEPDGSVAVGFNEEVKAPPPPPPPLPPPFAPSDNTAYAEILRISPGRTRRMSLRRRLSDESAARCKIVSQLCAFLLLLSSVANVALHQRVFDILNVIFICFTIVAITYDSISSRMYMLVHLLLATLSIPYFVAYLQLWGQAGHQVGCVVLCAFVMRWRELHDGIIFDRYALF